MSISLGMVLREIGRWGIWNEDEMLPEAMAKYGTLTPGELKQEMRKVHFVFLGSCLLAAAGACGIGRTSHLAADALFALWTITFVAVGKRLLRDKYLIEIVLHRQHNICLGDSTIFD